MTLAMDWRLASEQAKFGFVYTRRGIAPEGTGSALLPRIVGMPQALDWMLTGRVFDAAEALRGGLVSEVLPAEGLLPRARQLAGVIRDATSPVSVAVTRQLLWRQLDGGSTAYAHSLESRVVPWLASQPDAAEGVRAFTEKRSPDFGGSVRSTLEGEFPWAP